MYKDCHKSSVLDKSWQVVIDIISCHKMPNVMDNRR